MDLTCRRSHIEAHSLPDGWICTDSTSEDPLVLAKFSVDVHTLSANASLLVKVDKDFRSSVSCHGILVEGELHYYSSSTKQCHRLSTWQEVAVCHGNASESLLTSMAVDSTGVK